MKKVIKSVIAAAVLLTSGSVAQAQKLGHVHLDSLIAMMPEFKKAKEDGQTYYKKLEAQAIAWQKELETKLEEYKTAEAGLADFIKQQKQKELQDLNQRLEQFKQEAPQDIQKENDRLSKPVYEKARTAIQQVAKENAYKYIFDTSNGTVIYYEQSDNVMAMVKKKLNIVGLGALSEEKPAAPKETPKAPTPAPAPAPKK